MASDIRSCLIRENTTLLQHHNSAVPTCGKVWSLGQQELQAMVVADACCQVEWSVLSVVLALHSTAAVWAVRDSLTDNISVQHKLHYIRTLVHTTLIGAIHTYYAYVQYVQYKAMSRQINSTCSQWGNK